MAIAGEELTTQVYETDAVTAQTLLRALYENFVIVFFPIY